MSTNEPISASPSDDLVCGRWYLIHSSPPGFLRFQDCFVPLSPWLLPGCPILPIAIDRPFLIGLVPLTPTTDATVCISLSHYSMRPALPSFIPAFRHCLRPGTPHPTLHHYIPSPGTPTSQPSFPALPPPAPGGAPEP